jgi:(p)ppGpp synthase/HD superfamily hydrolase
MELSNNDQIIDKYKQLLYIEHVLVKVPYSPNQSVGEYNQIIEFCLVKKKLDQVLAKAYRVAAQKHTGQIRGILKINLMGTTKEIKEPYINHPIDVANLLTKAGADMITIIAGVLHDTIEDTILNKEEMCAMFGKNITDIVLECTDVKTKTADEKKIIQRENMSKSSPEAQLVKLADKYSNVRDLLKRPPSGWNKAESKGYVYWCYAIWKEATIKNEFFNRKYEKLFKDHNIVELEPSELEKVINEYYNNISKSN